jgi:predicted RNA-binding Zn-ribbon protein involved in translation (DUF1610 family)
MELRCRQCSWSSVCGVEAMVEWLRRHGRLKRAEQPQAAFVEELFLATADRFACPECGAVGLVAGPPREEDECWEIGRACQVCGQPIPAERLEAVPDTQVCARCKVDEEAGKTHEQPEYCPRCGAILQVQPTRGAGISRYRMVCPECGWT